MSSIISSSPVAVGPDERSPSDGTALTVLDLFAGAGGLTEGFDSAGGFRSVAAVELDRDAAASYQATFPDVEVHTMTVHSWLGGGSVPQVDVVVGGPPCQGFSLLNRREEEDTRNLLWQDYARVIVAAQPAYFVLENVATFLKSSQLADLRAATGPDGPLADYSFDARVLNAADYGAPQARRRTILIGHHRDLPPPGLPKASHVDRHRTVRWALRNVRPVVSGQDLPGVVTTTPDGTRRPGVFRTVQLHLGRRYEPVSERRIAAIPLGGNRFDLPDDLKAPCWVKHTKGSGDVMGRLWWDRPSVTIRTEFWKPEKGRYLHPEENRAITHYEAALLQGFSPTRKWVGTKTSIGRQIGNAVPISLGQAIAKHIARQPR